MDLINEELMKRNITFEQKLNEQQEQINKLNYELARRDEGFKQVEGEIEIIPLIEENQY